jgi:cellobiose phosphorylase
MYRLIAESLLGLRLETDRLRFAPCLPAHWTGLKIHYRYRETVYHIEITQVRLSDGEKPGVSGVTVDGIERHDLAIALVDDHQEHTVRVMVNA